MQKNRNGSLIKSIEILIADIEANFGKKRPIKSKKNLDIKKTSSQIYSDNLYDELDLWLLRLDSLFESMSDRLYETLEILKRKFIKVQAKNGYASNKNSHSSSKDKVEVLTAEIDQIFGAKILRFETAIKSTRPYPQSHVMSANELRDELERLLKGTAS